MPEGRGAPSDNFVAPKRDLGQEVLKFLLREARVHPKLSKERVAAVEQAHIKWDIITTTNAIVPADLLSPFESYLRSLLPYYDDGTLPGITQEFGGALFDLANNVDVIKGLVLASQRKGMTPPIASGDGSLLRQMITYPQQRELLSRVMTWLRNNDGYHDDAITEHSSETPYLKKLLPAIADYLLRTNRRKESPFPDLISDLLFSTDPKLDVGTGERCVVRFDTNGDPILTDAGKKLPQPLPAPFGNPGGERGRCGEALTGNQPVYDIRNLSQTVLGALLWDARRLIPKEVSSTGNSVPFPLNMTVGIRPLLEPIDPQTQGFSANSPVIKAVRAIFPLLKGPRTYKVLRGLARIVAKEKGELAAQLAMIQEISDIAGKDLFAKVFSDNTLFKDLLPILQDVMSSPGFVEDLLKALQTPGFTSGIKQGLIDMMRYRKDRITLQDYGQHKLTGQRQHIFRDKVDLSKGDNPGNLSYLQRMLHLLANVNGHKYASKLKSADGITIPIVEMRIDNLALFYLKAIIGKASVWDTIYQNGEPIPDGFLKDALAQSLPAMGLSEKPNPEQLGIFLNRELVFKDVPLVAGLKLTILLDDVIDKQGYKVRNHHADALLAALASGVVAKVGGALKPLAEVFDKHKKLPRLLELFVVLHRHWASDANAEKTKAGQPAYPSPRSNIRSMENILLQATEKAGLLERLESMGKVLSTLRLSDEPNAELATTSLQNYLAYVMGKPGDTYEKTPIGQLLESFRLMTKALEGPSKLRAQLAWNEATKSMGDLLLQVEGKGSNATFKNTRAPVVLESALKFLANRAELREKEGQWGPVLGRIQRDIEGLLLDPLMPPLLDLLDDLTKDREILRLFVGLLHHVVPDPTTQPKQFGDLLSLFAGLMAPIPDDIRVPIMRFMGTTIKKRAVMLRRLVVFLHRSIPGDTQDILLTLFRNAMTPHPVQNGYLVGMFGDIFSGINRLEPAKGTSLSAADLSAIMTSTSKYLLDKETGLEKLYTIVIQRNGTKRVH
tara:strand:- start:13260 stop:16292 length:3033 start_codon:yes stop_codon:yes gene_type:complete